MLVRGGKLMHYVLKPHGEPTWSASDYGRAATLEARWQSCGVVEDERRRLLPCAVWRAKWPGTSFPDKLMARLKELECK